MSQAKPVFLSSVNAADRGSSSVAASYAAPIVYVLCPDPTVRQSLNSLVDLAGWRPTALASVAEFEASAPTPAPSCLVLDAALLGLDGVDLLERLSADRGDTPIIFIVAESDVSTTVRVMKAGASEVLTQPIRAEALLAAIEQALEQSRAVLGEEAEVRAIRQRYASLSRRERETMALVVLGRLNKQIAGELGISEITVKAHRGRLMKKMAARCLPQLVIMYLRLGADS